MNKVWIHTAIVIGCLLTLQGAATAAGPPNNDVSDADHNTAGGTDALFNNTGADNTAFGWRALRANNTGGQNTASGAWARMICIFPDIESIPVMCPRRVDKSAEISPNFSPGMVTSIATIGSSNTGSACSNALRKAVAPAVLNACSELSTGWSLPK